MGFGTLFSSFTVLCKTNNFNKDDFNIDEWLKRSIFEGHDRERERRERDSMREGKYM